MFDVSDFDTVSASEKGAVMVVRHPADGVPLTDASGAEVTLVLAGQDSERCRSARRAAANRRLKDQVAGLRSQVTREEIENDNLEVLVACTLGWSGMVEAGVALTFSADNARKVYKRLPWLAEQAEAFIQDRAVFLKPSPKG